MENEISDEEHRRALIEELESAGSLTFVIGEDEEDFDEVVKYTRQNNVPVWTEVDKKEGTITIYKRPFGSLEGA